MEWGWVGSGDEWGSGERWRVSGAENTTLYQESPIFFLKFHSFQGGSGPSQVRVCHQDGQRRKRVERRKLRPDASGVQIRLRLHGRILLQKCSDRLIARGQDFKNITVRTRSRLVCLSKSMKVTGNIKDTSLL